LDNKLRIRRILGMGAFLISSELLFFRSLNQSLDRFAHGMGTLFQRATEVIGLVSAATKPTTRPNTGQSGGTVSAHPKAYPLSTWSNKTCRAKGRFQDRDYCESAVMDQIVSDGKSAIPVLISQITDSRWIAEPVYDYWPRIRTGELAYFILEDLFLEDTWQKSTMPALFPVHECNEPSWVCWGKFRKTHSLKELRARWFAGKPRQDFVGRQGSMLQTIECENRRLPTLDPIQPRRMESSS